MNSTEETQSRIRKYWDKRGRLNLWAGAITNQSLQGHAKRQAKNQEAEDSFVRRQAWVGEQGATAVEDMGHTILGDVTNPTPIVINSQPQSNGLGKVLVGAALAAGLMGIPAAGLVGFGISKLMDKPASETDDNTLDIGLGRVEDLLPAAK